MFLVGMGQNRRNDVKPSLCTLPKNKLKKLEKKSEKVLDFA